MPAQGVWKKLNLKDQTEIAVLDAPRSFEGEIAALEGVTVRRALPAAAGFVLAFVTAKAEIAPSPGRSARRPMATPSCGRPT